MAHTKLLRIRGKLPLVHSALTSTNLLAMADTYPYQSIIFLSAVLLANRGSQIHLNKAFFLSIFLQPHVLVDINHSYKQWT